MTICKRFMSFGDEYNLVLTTTNVPREKMLPRFFGASSGRASAAGQDGALGSASAVGGGAIYPSTMVPDNGAAGAGLSSTRDNDIIVFLQYRIYAR